VHNATGIIATPTAPAWPRKLENLAALATDLEALVSVGKLRYAEVGRQLFDGERLAVVNDRLSFAPAFGARQLDALLSHSAPENKALGNFKANKKDAIGRG
jgi:hypothetical protein